MKKFLSMLAACLLFACASIPALANGWGLRGGIYDVVSDDDRYEGYVSIADDGNQKADGQHVNHAILENRYHTVLIAARRSGQVWQAENISTTAVYQPGDERGEVPNNPQLSHTDDGFLLTCGDEEYHFAYLDGEYVLRRVRYPGEEHYRTTFDRQADGMLLFQTQRDTSGFPMVGEAVWDTDTITLAEFNITQMPRTIQEVARMNRVRRALDGEDGPLAVTSTWTGTRHGSQLPVYSAPDKASYRAASGKASVSLAGDADIFGTAEGWTLIQYEVSFRTSRIGWIEGDFSEIGLTFANVPLTTTALTFLTDDPFVSQYAHIYIHPGTQVTGLARCGEYYAYVEWTADGMLHRGFVPMKDLDTTYDLAMSRAEKHPMSAVRWDVMATLVGKWKPEEGSNFSQMIFYEDGYKRSFLPFLGADPEEQNFRVYGEGADGQYEIVFYAEDNSEYHYDLDLCQDGSITLSDGESVTRFFRDEYSTYGNG